MLSKQSTTTVYSDSWIVPSFYVDGLCNTSCNAPLPCEHTCCWHFLALGADCGNLDVCPIASFVTIYYYFMLSVFKNPFDFWVDGKMIPCTKTSNKICDQTLHRQEHQPKGVNAYYWQATLFFSEGWSKYIMLDLGESCFSVLTFHTLSSSSSFHIWNFMNSSTPSLYMKNTTNKQSKTIRQTLKTK